MIGKYIVFNSDQKSPQEKGASWVAGVKYRISSETPTCYVLTFNGRAALYVDKSEENTEYIVKQIIVGG